MQSYLKRMEGKWTGTATELQTQDGQFMHTIDNTEEKSAYQQHLQGFRFINQSLESV